MSRLCLSMCAVAGACCFASGSDTLLLQAPSSGSAAISARDGTAQFSFANRRRADNFSFGSAVTVDTIRFWGGDETGDPSPDLVNLSGFNIRIYDSAGGVPGAIIYETTVSKAQTNPTPTGMGVGLLGASMYTFTADLAAPVELGAGDYFLSIGAFFFNQVNFTNESWQWAGSQPGDGIFFSDSFNGDGFQPLPGASITNLAFEMIGVPAPGSALGVIGVLALAMRRRR